jgi:hypothetical protein
MTIIARHPSQQMVDLVGALGGTWHGNTAMCRCPAHTDKTPSLSIRQGDRGLLVTCFAGCQAGDILRELDRIPLGRRYDPPAPVAATGTANIDRLWGEAVPVNGTLAERYLASRMLLPVPTDVRFHSRCPLGHEQSSNPRCWSVFARRSDWSPSSASSWTPQQTPTPKRRRSGRLAPVLGGAAVSDRRLVLQKGLKPHGPGLA